MKIAVFCISVILGITGGYSFSQAPDSTAISEQLSGRYVKNVEHKMEQYSSRVFRKTIKTLTKLSGWENKIKRLLEHVNPAAANKLFHADAMTFGELLKKVSTGEIIVEQYQAQYHKYADDATTTFKYLANQHKATNSVTGKRIDSVAAGFQNFFNKESSIELVHQIIKERRKLLVKLAIQYLGNGRYSKKINKEVFYYAERIKNYKKMLAEPGKAEQLVTRILNKLPAFRKFMERNSILGKMFTPAATGTENDVFVAEPGLQTRASVQDVMQGSIASGGAGARERVQQGIQSAQAQVSQLRNKLPGKLPEQSVDDMPAFNVNQQRARTFLQRLDIATNIHSAKSNNYFPVTTDLGLSIGYKINDKSIAGLGVAYKVGWGSGFDHIAVSFEGIGLRFFIDHTLKGSLSLSGGYEQTYQSKVRTIAAFQNISPWYSSALIGLSKKIKAGNNKARVQLSYDFFCRNHLPFTQPFIYRIMYNLK